MSYTLHLDDQEFLANGEEIDLQVQSPDGTWKSMCVVPTACRYPMSAKEVARSNGRYQGQDQIWTVSKAEVDAEDEEGIDILPGWRVVDAKGNKHTILESTLSDLGGFWKLMSRNKKIVYALRDVIEIRRYAQSPRINRQGRRMAQTPTAVYSDLTCRIQMQDRAKASDFGIPQLAVNFDVYVDATYLDIGIGDQVVIISKPDRPSLEGAILEITSINNSDSLDQLVSLVCANENAQVE